MTGQVEAAEEPFTISPSVDPKLVGIRGWLILPAIGLVLTPIASVMLLITFFIMFFDHMSSLNSTFFVAVAVMISLTLVSIYAASQFFKKKRNAPSVIVTLILINTGTSILMYVVQTNSGQQTEALVRLAIQIIATVVWIPYFRISERVKATFVN